MKAATINQFHGSKDQGGTMELRTHNSSRPSQWDSPRPHSDASTRLQKHGRILPMEGEEPGLFERFFKVVRKATRRNRRR
jgi:hypothetical protein